MENILYKNSHFSFLFKLLSQNKMLSSHIVYVNMDRNKSVFSPGRGSLDLKGGVRQLPSTFSSKAGLDKRTEVLKRGI